MVRACSTIEEAKTNSSPKGDCHYLKALKPLAEKAILEVFDPPGFFIPNTRYLCYDLVTMQCGYRFLEHTADIGIEVYSARLEGLFEIAGQALFTLIAPRPRRAKIERVVTSEGDEPELLLVNFLNDLLLLFEVEKLLFRKFETRTLEAGCLVVHALCERMDPDGREVETVVKAATHHNVKVRREGSLWRAEVYLDL